MCRYLLSYFFEFKEPQEKTRLELFISFPPPTSRCVCVHVQKRQNVLEKNQIRRKRQEKSETLALVLNYRADDEKGGTARSSLFFCFVTGRNSIVRLGGKKKERRRKDPTVADTDEGTTSSGFVFTPGV